jgi:hypothetical protein
VAPNSPGTQYASSYPPLGHETNSSIGGKTLHYIHPGENRPRLDAATYGRRTLWDNIGVLNAGLENKAAGRSMIDTVRTMVFPNIIWVIAVNSLFISVQGAAGQTGSSVLIAAG